MKEQRIILSEIFDFSRLPKKLIEHYHTHLLCQKGRVDFRFNDQQMSCKAGAFFFWFAGSKVRNIDFGKNFKATVLLVARDYLNDNVPDQSWGINATLYSRQNPVKHLKDEQERKKILLNFKTLHNRYLEFDHRFYEELLRLQMQIFILEMWSIFAHSYERHKHSMQSGTLLERFMLLVAEHCMEEREVKYYADQLHITPKYLNQVIKAGTGNTASEWIQRHARENIILLLQNKNLNLAEIADQMNFSSRSFFTRYVKKMLGVTPTEYRERMV